MWEPCWAGWRRAFFAQSLDWAAWCSAWSLAAWNYGRIAVSAQAPRAQSKRSRTAIGFLLIAVVVMVLAGILGVLLSKAFQKVGLGCLDSLAGAIFGFFQGALLVTVCHPGHGGFLSRIPSGLTQVAAAEVFFWRLPSEHHVSPSWLAERVGRS